MIKILMVTFAALVISMSVDADTSILVITHKDTPVDTLSRKQIKNVYLGAPLDFETIPLMLPSDSEIRQQFNTRVIGLSESRLRSYIAQMRFSGRALPLIEVDTVDDVVEKVSQNPGHIGYVSSSTPLNDNIRIIYQQKVE